MRATPTTVYPKSQGERFSADCRLVTVVCTCGIMFAIPESLNDSALEYRGQDGWQISCPLGHTWHYTGETKAQKLARQLRDERQRSGYLAADRDQVVASLRATKGVVTKMKKRAQAGVCPAGCHRHFADLARHIASQHPDFHIES